MSLYPCDTADEYSFPTPRQPYRRHSLGLIWNLLLLVLIFLYIVTLALPALAADLTSLAPTSINRSLPGSQRGTLMNAQGPVLEIDRTMYKLAPMALVEDKFGTPLNAADFKWNGVEFRVQYWTASEHGPNHITQLIINFPE